jgi:hypothetical protein
MLTVGDVVAHEAWLSRRFAYASSVSPRTIREALDEAALLALEERDEPAAIFFSFVRRPEELGEAWRHLPPVLAKTQARKAGLLLAADMEDFRSLRFAVNVDRLPFDDVRAWFRTRLG